MLAAKTVRGEYERYEKYAAQNKNKKIIKTYFPS